jgi:hypothetical protein
MCSKRYYLLRDRRRGAEKQRCEDEHRRSRRDCSGGEREGQGSKLDGDKPPTLDKIAERNEQEEAGGISKLGRGRDECCKRSGQIALHYRKHRLVVIDVGNRDSGGSGHRKGQRIIDRWTTIVGHGDLLFSNFGHLRGT